MKRSFCVLFVLVFLPLVSFASAASKYIGVWIHYQTTGISSRQYIIYEISDNGKAYYSRESFNNDGSSAVETGVFSWIDDGATVRIMDGDEVFKELRYVDDTRLIPAGYSSVNYYFRVLRYDDEIESLYSAYSPREPNLDPFGRWTSFLYVPDMESMPLQSVDYYFFEDGSVYSVTAYRESSAQALQFGSSSGIWIGDHTDMTLRVGDVTYKAFIDSGEIMHLKTNSGLYLLLYRVPSDRQVYEIPDELLQEDP